VLTVHPSLPARTPSELVTYAKANPGKITYGTPGAGTSLHITMEQIARQQGIKWVHVPFRGNAEAMTSLLGGHIEVLADSTGWAPQVNEGKFRLLVTWGATRTRNWPNVPTLRDIGIDIVSNSPYGIGGPKGMDPRVVKVLQDAFRQGLEEPANLEKMALFDQERFYLSSEDYHRFAMQQIVEQKQMIEDLGLKEK